MFLRQAQIFEVLIFGAEKKPALSGPGVARGGEGIGEEVLKRLEGMQKAQNRSVTWLREKRAENEPVEWPDRRQKFVDRYRDYPVPPVVVVAVEEGQFNK